MMHYELHPLCTSIPDMTDEEFQNIVKDIAETGLKQPITLFEGKILLGKNRYRACKRLGIEGTFETYEGDDPLGYIFSFTYYKTHFTTTQLVTVALEALEYEELRAKQRKSEAAIASNKKRAISDEVQSPQSEKSDEVEPSPVAENPPKRAPQARDIVAKKVGVSGTSVGIGKRIRTLAPEIYDKMKMGTLELADAKVLALFKEDRPELFEEAVRRQEQYPEVKARQIINGLKNDIITASNKALTFETGKKYKIIYADPPWSYGEPHPIIAGIENHYPTMSIPQLCAMGPDLKKVVADDALLAIWTTSPHLQLCFEVVKAWGFEYKTTLVWHKVKHNVGYYGSNRAEFLLLCTKGSCTPPRHVFIEDEQGKLQHDTFHPEPSVFPSRLLKPELFHMDAETYEKEFEWESVVYEENRTEHSVKPKYYYGLLERMYGDCTKLEMFCRKPHQGWDSWGNQAETKPN